MPHADGLTLTMQLQVRSLWIPQRAYVISALSFQIGCKVDDDFNFDP
jgi:hypothetical protein